MSVLENVMTGLHVRHASSLFATLLGLPGFWRAESSIARRATELVEMLGLEFPEARAGDLAYGQQRRVEIARAVASEPEILLLDEPVAGMNEKESAELSALIARINSELGIAVVVVEHDIRFVMDLCDRIQVLNRGETLTEGSVETVRNDPAVIEAYLGTRRNRANA
jgi:branched-chain amino acid transport system ATP-binding protein